MCSSDLLATGGSAIRTCEILQAAGIPRLIFLALIAASVWIARKNWQDDPEQRTGHHLATWGMRFFIGTMWFQGSLWKLPLPTRR